MERELPFVKNNVTFQVAAKSTTFEKLDCFHKIWEKCESQSIRFSELWEVHLPWLVSLERGCTSAFCLIFVLLFLRLSKSINITRDLCIQRGKLNSAAVLK